MKHSLRRWRRHDTAGYAIELVTTAAANGLAGAVAAALADSPEARLPAALRATGNGTFVAFAAPFALQAARSERRGWWTYVGAHVIHAACLVTMARRHRLHGGTFSGASRYGGALGYATIAALGATSYKPAGTPSERTALRRQHRLGEQFLFGLYGFTITHGYVAKGKNRVVYGPLGALWLIAAARGRARWDP